MKRLENIPGSAFFPFCGHRSLVGLVGSARITAQRILDDVAQLETVCLTVLRKHELLLGKIRIPLDVLRTSITAQPSWIPAEILALNCSRGTDLAKILDALLCGVTPAKVVPLLCDVNIYYRVMKFLYSESYVALDVHTWLKRMPLIFGKWHLYKQTIITVYHSFFPIFGTPAAPFQPKLSHLLSP